MISIRWFLFSIFSKIKFKNKRMKTKREEAKNEATCGGEGETRTTRSIRRGERGGQRRHGRSALEFPRTRRYRGRVPFGCHSRAKDQRSLHKGATLRGRRGREQASPVQRLGPRARTTPCGADVVFVPLSSVRGRSLCGGCVVMTDFCSANSFRAFVITLSQIMRI